jgi:hypothetical protein
MKDSKEIENSLKMGNEYFNQKNTMKQKLNLKNVY